jgi:alpha-tubulin suppressor-like RCC1 family protein
MKDISQPEEIKFFSDKRVTKISCGDYHTMIMTQDDEIYAFGEGTLGQLGTGGK